MSRPNVNIVTYKDRQDLWPEIAGWHAEAWHPNRRPEEILAGLTSRHCSDSFLPWGMIAMDASGNSKPVGTLEIKLFEMVEVPEYEWWIGEVFVIPAARGQGLAAWMMEQAFAKARDLGIPYLALQTARLDGGLYARSGFKPMKVIKRQDGETRLLMHWTA